MDEPIDKLLDEMNEVFDKSFDNECQAKFQSDIKKQEKVENNPQSALRSDCDKLQKTDEQAKQKAPSQILFKDSAVEQKNERDEILMEMKQTFNNEYQVCNEEQNRNNKACQFIEASINDQQQKKIRLGKSASQQQIDHKKEGSDEEDKGYYHALTLKLEAALKKNLTQPLIKSPKGSYNDFYERTVQFKKKKEQDITQLKKENEEKIRKMNSHKPLLNSKSMLMLNHYQPLQKRYKQVVEEKNKKIEERRTIKTKIEEEKRVKEEQQLHDHNKQIIKKIGHFRSQEEYFEEMIDWQKNVSQKVQALAVKQSDKLTSENTFKPKINKMSSAIMKKQDRIPIYEREIEPKLNRLGKEYTFKPKTNKKK